MQRVIILLLALTLTLVFSSAALAEDTGEATSATTTTTMTTTGEVAPASEWTGNVNFLLGQKLLASEWTPVDEHDEIGIEIDFGKKSWPVNIAIDYMYSRGEKEVGSLTLKGETRELNVGVRKIFSDDNSNVNPFFGGGLSFITAESSIEGRMGVDGNGTGYWFGGGAYWTYAESFNIGFELKRSKADVEYDIFGRRIDVSAGGTHFGLLFGYHW